MIETTRRSFLFGLGAVIALAKTKIIEPVTAVPLDENSKPTSTRSYFGIYINKNEEVYRNLPGCLLNLYRE
jgi:hypothetical protein